MKFSVKLPVTVRVDSVGAIIMADNITATSHTKHVDTWYKHVTEYVANGIAKIVFVKSDKNDSNILMKNNIKSFMISTQRRIVS